MPTQAEPDRGSENGGDKDAPDTHDTPTIQGIRNLNAVWGLTEIAQLYRTPVAELVSEHEAAEIERLQARRPLPGGWPEELCVLVRASARFNEWLRALPSRDLPAFGGKTARVDSTLPWCVRLRWGARVGTTVDIFVCATAER